MQAFQSFVKQAPALRAVTTRLDMPAGRALLAIAPIAHLKPRVGFANVVQKGQHRQASAVSVSKTAARCPLQGALYCRQVQQAVCDGSNIRHMIYQAMGLGRPSRAT